MNPLLFLILEKATAENPFNKVETFLKEKIIEGFLSVAGPIATLAFIGLGIAAMMSTDEHQRQKFKSGLWWTGLAAIICFSADMIVDWLEGSFVKEPTDPPKK